MIEKQYFKRLLASRDCRVGRVQVVGVEASWNRELPKQQQEEMPSYGEHVNLSCHPRDILQLAPTSSTLS